MVGAVAISRRMSMCCTQPPPPTPPLAPSHCRECRFTCRFHERQRKLRRTSAAHTHLTVNGGTSAGRWTSRRAPFFAAALVTAQLVALHAWASTHSHLHITLSEGSLSHSQPHTHRRSCKRSRAAAAAADLTALVRGLACVPEAARRRKTLLSACSSAQLLDRGQMH